MTYKVTLHVDLLKVTLDDFVQHFDNAIPHTIRWGEPGGDEVPPTALILWNREQKDVQVGHWVGTDFTVRVHSKAQGTIGHTWRFTWKPPYDEFVLTATRFKGDSLMLKLQEYMGLENAPVYGPKLRDWLSRRWGKKGYELIEPVRNVHTVADAEKSKHNDSTPRKKPLTDLENQWLDRVKQGRASGNIAQFCEENQNKFSRTTWYGWEKKFKDWGLL